MKAIHVIGYEKAVLTDAPMPEPKPDEILVRVRRVGICHSDVEVFRQELGIYRSGGASLPIIPGHEWAGEIVETGAQVKGFVLGDRVTSQCGIGCGKCALCAQGLGNICPDRVETGVFNRNGAYAEYIAVPYTHAHHLYDLSDQEGALVEPFTVGEWICRRAGIGPGDRVGIIGTGTVGIVAAQMARLHGADQVVAFGRKPFKIELARQMGADQAFNLEDQSLDEVTPEVTGGKGFNVVIEAVGVPEGATIALRAAAPRGRVVITGVFEGEMQTIDLNTIMPKELTVIGSLGGPQVFDDVIALIREGKIQVKPINTHYFPLAMAAEAVRMVAEGRPDLVKAHLDCMAA
jgi:2-desacetyl-2-hydroxyethyl bacteriochlorophyllide A dehydrogenase